jgi:membrane-bound inhibitor of C-type lysozyme
MDLLTTATALLGLSATGAQAAMQFVFPLEGDAERKIVTYQCEGIEQPFPVEYINAAPNFLALIPVEAKQLIFASTLSADGTRYVSGPFEWWVRGTDATFADLRQEPAQPVNCTEKIETP